MSVAVPPVRKPGLFERLNRGGPPLPDAPDASSAPDSPPRQPGLFQLVDWRLVAAIGLPLWAFLIGFIVAQRSAPRAPVPEPAAVAEFTGPNPPAPAPEEPIPAPREVVVRTEVVAVPVAVPVVVPGEGEPVAAAPGEFKLPASEVLPGDRCKTFETKIRFHGGLPEAAEEAKLSKKMLLVLHISGNFDDPGFT
jgi:hypothetical protein